MTQPVESSPIVRAQGLAVGYASRRILENVNWEIRAGEFWCLLGTNGVGKTTLLRVLLGLLSPLSGRLEFASSIQRGAIGFVPQRGQWNESMPTTVSEFVSLGFVGTGANHGERRQRLTAALATVGGVHFVTFAVAATAGAVVVVFFQGGAGRVASIALISPRM